MNAEEMTFLYLSIGYFALMLASMMLASVSILSDDAFTTWAFLAISGLLGSYGFALFRGGINRRLWSRVEEYDHPPLTEQIERLTEVEK